MKRILTCLLFVLCISASPVLPQWKPQAYPARSPAGLQPRIATAGQLQGRSKAAAFAKTQMASPSKPRGRALLVGVNEYQVKGVRPTPGSIEDAVAFSKLLVNKGWFEAQDVKTLLGPQATAANIAREFKTWLIDGTKPGDRVFFLYSGHGTQVPDDDGDERRQDSSDDKDEAIAPYDVNAVNQRLVNYIRDDQFNDWLAQLGGRSIVLLFDSCNSGTVSRGSTSGGAGTTSLGPRYLPSPDQWDWSVGSRSLSDGSYEISDGPASRNLKLVVDKPRLAPNSTLAVFSAAQSHQLAYPMQIPPGGVRGAFSYFVEMELTRGNPPLRDLRQSVVEKIKRAQKVERTLKGEQEPDFEVSAPSLMNDQPLFGGFNTSASLPLLAPGFSNAASTMRLSLRLGALNANKELLERSTFCFGEEANYRITTSTPGYLYLLVFSRNDVATVIYPGKGEQEFFEAGTHQLDGFPVQAPAGKDVVVALLTKEKLALKERLETRGANDPPLSWKQVFDWLGTSALEQVVSQRGQGERRKGKLLSETDWQAAVLLSEAVERCDQIRRQ